MKTKIVLYLLLSLCIIGIVNAELGQITVNEGTPKWKVKYSNENDILIPEIQSKNIHSTELCLKIKDGKEGEQIPMLKKVTDKDGNLITNVAKAKKNGKDSYCISPQANENYIKIGDHSTVFVYEGDKKIEYIDGTSVTDVQLFKLIDGEYTSDVQDIFIHLNDDNIKFGAVDEGNLNLANYKYIISSNKPLINDGYNVYYYERYYGSVGYVGDYINEEYQYACQVWNENTQQYDESTCYGVNKKFVKTGEDVRLISEQKNNIDFTDVCTKPDAMCEFSQISDNAIQITFLSDKNIDPLITYDSSYYNNNTLHLNTGHNSYMSYLLSNYSDNCALYANFDSNLSGNFINLCDGKDMTMTTGASIVSGRFSNALEFNVTNGGLKSSINTMLFTNELTVCAWINDFTYTNANENIVALSNGGSGYTFAFDHGYSNSLRLKVYNQSNNNGTIGAFNNIFTGRWQFECGTYNSTHIVTYQNATILTNTQLNLTFNFNSSTDKYFYISRLPSGFMNISQIDSVFVLNKSLTSTEISNLYNSNYNFFKSQGSVIFPQETLSDTTNDRYKFILHDSQYLNGSSLKTQLGYWDTSYGYNSTWQDGSTALKHYFTFDGNIVDNVTGTTGTSLQNLTYAIPAKYGDGIYANGLDGKTLVNLSFNDYYQNFTIGMWYKRPSGATTGCDLLFRGTGARPTASVSQLGFLTASVYNGSTQTALTNNLLPSNPPLLKADTWYYITFSLKSNMGNNGIFKLYVNGTMINSSSSFQGTLHDDSSYWYIFNRRDLIDGVSNCVIDDWVIFNDTLSDAQVMDLYTRGLANWKYTNEQTVVNNATNGFSARYTIPTSATNIYPLINLYNNVNNGYTPILSLYNPMTLYSYKSTDEFSISYNAGTPTNGARSTSNIIDYSVNSANPTYYTFNNWNNSLVAWYRFNNEYNENLTFINDFSNNNLDLITNNTFKYTNNAKFKLAINNNYSASFFITNKYYINTYDETICAWINLTSTSITINGRIWDNSMEVFGVNNSRGNLIVDLGGGPCLSNLFVRPNEYNFICYNILLNGSLLFYVNDSSELNSSNCGKHLIQSHTGQVFNRQSGDRMFNGSIDELIIFNRSLSSDEIKALYDGSKTQFTYASAPINEINTFQACGCNADGECSCAEPRTYTYDPTYVEYGLAYSGNPFFAGYQLLYGVSGIIILVLIASAIFLTIRKHMDVVTCAIIITTIILTSMFLGIILRVLS